MPRTDKLSTYRTTWAAHGDCGTVTYIRTEIVRWDAGTITLRSGGWQTVTTKRKMNQAARQFGLGYCVFQRKGEWFVDTGCMTRAGWKWEGRDMPFHDGFTIARLPSSQIERT